MTGCIPLSIPGLCSAPGWGKEGRREPWCHRETCTPHVLPSWSASDAPRRARKYERVGAFIFTRLPRLALQSEQTNRQGFPYLIYINLGCFPEAVLLCFSMKFCAWQRLHFACRGNLKTFLLAPVHLRAALHILIFLRLSNPKQLIHTMLNIFFFPMIIEEIWSKWCSHILAFCFLLEHCGPGNTLPRWCSLCQLGQRTLLQD